MKNHSIEKQSAFLHVRKLSRLMTKYLDKVIASHSFKINSLQFHLLVSISNNTAKSVQSISDRLGMDKATLIRNCERLISEGYAKDISDEFDDKRMRILSTTEKGEKIIEDITPIFEEENNEFLKHSGEILCDYYTGKPEEAQFMKDMKEYEDIMLSFLKKNFFHSEYIHKGHR